MAARSDVGTTAGANGAATREASMICPSCNADTAPEKHVEIAGAGGRRGGPRVRMVCRACQEPWPVSAEPAPAPPLALVPAPKAEPVPTVEPAQAPSEPLDPIAVCLARLDVVTQELTRLEALKSEARVLKRMLAAGDPARRTPRTRARKD